MSYTHEACEKLVMLADDNGNVFYKDIQKAFPDTSSDFLYDWIGDSFITQDDLFDLRIVRSNPITPMLYWIDRPETYNDSYKFKPDDKFTLSTAGKDLRYQVLKERRQEELTVKALATAEKSLAIEKIALKEARISKYCSIIAAIGTIIGIFVSLWLSR